MPKIRLCYTSDANPKVRESYSIRSTPEGTSFAMSLKGRLTGGTLERMLHAHELLHKIHHTESVAADGMFSQPQQIEPTPEEVLEDLRERLKKVENGEKPAEVFVVANAVRR